MDFLEIRRKAKERAAARAAAAQADGDATARAGAPVEPARPAEPPRPLALDPLPLPGGPAPEPLDVERAPEPGRSTQATRHLVGADPDALAEEAARIEAALAERLESLPAAPDGRFKTWRPVGHDVPDVAPVAPEPDEPPARDEARPAAPPRRRAPGDPLDDFFYRDDERGPGLGGLAPQVAPDPLVEPVERVEYLTFRLGTEEYGVEIDRVREVMRSPPITEVPRAPPSVLGVITVRGEVVAVFDPRMRLGLPPSAEAGTGRVVIVDDGGGPCGLLVDGVSSVVRLPRGSIEPCPQGIGGSSADCLAGIGRDQDRLFTLLDLGALLKPRRAGEARG